MMESNRKENNRPNAVFAPEDFELLRKAVGHYVKTCEQYCASEEEISKYLSLYHRLGRL